MKVVPSLVHDDSGRLCLQLKLGSHMATLPLPHEFEKRSPQDQSAFITLASKEMTKGLIQERGSAQKKLRRST